MKKLYEKPEIVVSSFESKEAVAALTASSITEISKVLKTKTNVISF